MRIVRTYDVTFAGFWEKDASFPDSETYWIQDDEGKRFQVSIPTHNNIHELFLWLNENDCLRHLKDLEPIVKTNLEEIQEVEKHNNWFTENSYAFPQYRNQTIVDPKTGIQTYFGWKIAPRLTYSCTWQFWSREHAIMFKLAKGGSQ